MIDQSVTPADLSSQLHALNGYLEQIASFLSHLTLGGASAHAIEWFKAKPSIARVWALLSGRGKVIVTAIFAAIGSLGITIAFTQDAAHPGVYALTISGLTWTSIGQHLWSFVQSWIAQQGWFQVVIKPKAVTGVAAKPHAPEPPPVVVEGVRP